MSAPSAELFQAVIDDHRRRPRNRGAPPSANRVARRENPACGDVCVLHLEIAPGDLARVAAIGFTGAGCALSQASASLATSALAGLPVPAALALITEVETLVRTGVSAAPAATSAHPERPPTAAPALGDVAALAAAHAFPARHACALLAWQAAREALAAPA